MTAKKNESGDRHPVPGDDVKKRFREALDRKNAHGGRDVSADGEASKVHEANGPAKRQMFRRKSGG